MMSKRMPETCWAVFERRTINLRDWCIWLVDLFENLNIWKQTSVHRELPAGLVRPAGSSACTILQSFKAAVIWKTPAVFLITFFLCVFANLNSSNHLLWVQRSVVAPDHSDTHTLGRTPLDEGSTRRRGLCLTTT
jgi:hypothetical protein